MIEARVEKYLCDRVVAAGGLVRKLQWIGRRGAPDRAVLLPGRGLSLVELKRPGKGAEAHQAREHSRLRSFGVPVFVLPDLAAVDDFMVQA